MRLSPGGAAGSGAHVGTLCRTTRVSSTMSQQHGTSRLDSRQAILDELNALLESSNGIDEARAKRLRKALDALRNSDAKPAATQDSHQPDTPLDTEIDARLETLRARIHKQVERRNRSYQQALALMDALEGALRDKELQQAERSEKKLLSLMRNIPGLSEQRWQNIEDRLQRARPQIRELESWRHWGTTQAREELIARVRQLTDSNLAPEKIAKSIQAAREQWHAWDKAGDHSGKDLWKAFDQACESAYKPCSAHFEKLRQQRADNLRQRREIIDSLNARFRSIDWKQPDWRETDKFVRHARRSFYNTGNVDFKYRKPVARALDEVLEKFEKHLARERSRCFRAREKLIADIEALADVDNLHEALNRLGKLKKQWAITVVEKRGLENRLWKRFQAACDSTYQRRDTERKAQFAERDENLKQKQALIEEIDRSARASDAELLAHASGFARQLARWQEIGAVPRKHETGLNRRWLEVQRQFRGAVKAAESRARAAELDNLTRRAALCNVWEQATLAGSTIDTAAVTAEWEALPALSSDRSEAINRRFGQALVRPDDTTLSNNLAIKQDACLRLEVMLELDSPAQFQGERMAYQVARLNASLHKDPDAQDSPEDLLLRALTTGAVPAAAVETIEQRIKNCITRHTGNP